MWLSLNIYIILIDIGLLNFLFVIGLIKVCLFDNGNLVLEIIFWIVFFLILLNIGVINL